MMLSRVSDLDTLELCGLEVACVIGDRPEERDREQRLVVDVVLSLDLASAGASDALADTVDYAALAGSVRAALRAARYRMIESAAECVARACLADSRVRSVRVRVEKPGAIAGLRAAAVVIERERGRTPDAQRSTCNVQRSTLKEGGHRLLNPDPRTLKTRNAQRSTRNAQGEETPTSDLRPPISGSRAGRSA